MDSHITIFYCLTTLGVMKLCLRETSKEIRPLLWNNKSFLLCSQKRVTELLSISDMQSTKSHHILLTFILIIFSSMRRCFKCCLSFRFSDRNYILILYCSITEELRLNNLPKIGCQIHYNMRRTEF
jgi:hypothetical protein